ncbi:synaptobrevin/VAMP-like protein [Encephalitozoon cuniculi EcunIII-L]|uniref:V-SNARE coiled-coil homology domain-containing protein n=1 Tax=Encephalitozoon cuniculi TaxID=6035 RepID=M1KL41_ENCCN|nr:hypothetical protein ECU03_0530 [Encephalitozoon cuniculi]KMV66417.1 synaptobrevin/VAMP-like protein [Encephalitozoon cuniculi EcunIII-L]UYI28044.1 synaptobrevin-like protein Ykt6 [Encephalitozoon cuniculi]
MAIISLVVINVHTRKVKAKAFSLGQFSFFTRGKVRETLMFISQELAEKLETYEFQEYTHEFNDKKTYRLFSLVHNDLAYIACADDDYPGIVALKLLQEARHGDIEKLIEEYKDPASKHTLLQIQNEVEETKGALSKTLMAVLERNDKLEDLVAKSEHLCYETKLLFKSAKKKNRCC